MAEKKITWRDISDVKIFLEEGGDTAHAFAPGDEKWRDASPDEERACRLECLRHAIDFTHPADIEISEKDVVGVATAFSNFVLGLVKAEKVE